MADDEMKLIYQHIIEADQSSSRAKGVTMNALKAWWISDTGVAHDDECDFRRALRLRGVFTACKSSLLNLADPTASHLATRQLFQRINVVCDYHQEGRDRVTMDNLKVLCRNRLRKELLFQLHAFQEPCGRFCPVCARRTSVQQGNHPIAMDLRHASWVQEPGLPRSW